jgi:hypothetical protein
MESLNAIAAQLMGRCLSADGSFALVEEALDKAIAQVRGQLVDLALASAQNGFSRELSCDTCRNRLTRWGGHSRVIVTAHGEGRLPVERWHCRWCNKDVYPILVRNGLTDSQYTIGARRVIAEEAAEAPYAHAARRLSVRGIIVSATQVDQIAQEIGHWRAHEEECARAYLMLSGRDLALPLHDKSAWERVPAHVAGVLSVDGGKVRSTTPAQDGQGLEWFETRAGVVSLNCDEAPKVFVAGMKEPDKLFETLLSQSRPLVGKRLLVFVADGARWIWDRVTQFFPKAVQVLDIYHAAEHVGSAARACWGAESEQANQWVSSARRMLMQPGGLASVLRELCQCLKRGTCVDADQVKMEMRYLWTNRGRMHYAQLIAQGLPIGSGIMESAIKQTSSQRLRQPGMMWTRERANLMLRLRAACLNDSLHFTTQRHEAIAAKQFKVYAKAA